MRKPSSPLRRVTAVVLSLLILPWQQPLLAFGQTAAPAVVTGFNLEKPREALDALDVRLDALIARVKSDDFSKPAEAAALSGDLLKLKADYQAALDGYIAAEAAAAEAAKATLKPLITPSKGQILVEAMVLNDFGGLRAELNGLLVLEKSFGRLPSEIKAEEWAKVETDVPDFKAKLTPLSARVDKARLQAPAVAAEARPSYEEMAAALHNTMQNLRGRSSKLDLDGLLAAKPNTASGDAAGALTAEIAKKLPLGEYKSELASVNRKLSGYLRSGNPQDLQAAVGEIDALYDAAKITDKGARADLFKHIGDVARDQSGRSAAASAAAAAPVGQAGSVLTSNGIHRGTDVELMKKMDGLALPHDEPEAPVQPAASTLLADMEVAALAAKEALRFQAESLIGGTNAFVSKKATELADRLTDRTGALRAEDALDKAEAMVQALLARAKSAGKAEDLPTAEQIAEADALVTAAASVGAALKSRHRTVKTALGELQVLVQQRRSASEAAAKELAFAYARVETLIVKLVMEAPDRTTDPAPAGERAKEAYDKKWLARIERLDADWQDVQKELNVASYEKAGVKGPGVWGWSLAVGAISDPPRVLAGDAAPLEPARVRAESLIKLFAAMTAQKSAGALDITLWKADFRRKILYADGKDAVAGLGEFGKAIIARNDADAAARAKGDEVMARFNERFGGLKLTGDVAADRASLDAFFDDAANAKAIAEGAQVPPAIAQWYAARKFDADNAALKAAGKPEIPRPAAMPTVEEIYPRLVTATRLEEVRKLGEGEKRTVGELYLAQFELNRSAALTVCGDKPKPAGVSDAARAKFCADFTGTPAKDYTQDEYQRQRAMTDLLQPYLETLPLTQAADKAKKSSDALIARLRALSPEARAAYRERGVDVDGILRQSEQAQIGQWAVAVYELGITKDPAAWREFRDGVIERGFGDRTELATGAQSRELRAAVDAGDAAAIGRAVDGIESPSVLTSGFAYAVPRMLASERATRSSRDRQILRAWNGGEDDGPPSASSIAGQLLGAAAEMEKTLAKPEAALPGNKAAADEIRRGVALIKTAVADPSDPERLLEAMRVARFTVWDSRAARVGLDTTKLPVAPKNDEERRDLEAGLMLARMFQVPEGELRTAAGAAKIRDGMKAKLKTDVADAHEQNRRDQLLLSSQDEYTDRVFKLGQATAKVVLPEAELTAAAARGDKFAAAELAARSRGTAPFSELAALAAGVRAYQNDTDALTRATYELGRSAAGRANLGLPGAFAEAKTQTMAALYSAHGPDGLTVSGWMVGIDAKDVKREKNYRSAGVAADPHKLTAGEEGVIGTAGRPDAPKGPPVGVRRDGISYEKDGVAVFRELKTDYSETRSRKTEKITVDGKEVEAKVSTGRNAAGEEVTVYTQGGRTFILETRGSIDPRTRAVTNTVTRRDVTAADLTALAPVETVQVFQTENGRQAVSLIERRAGPGGETLNWTRFYQPAVKGGSYDSVSMDLAGHSQTVTVGSLRTTFDLTKDNAHLEESRRRTTYDLSGPAPKLVMTQYYSIGKDADGARTVKAVVERPRTDLSHAGEATITEIRDYRLAADTGDDNKRDGFGKPTYRNSIASLSTAQLDQAIIGNRLVADGREDGSGGPRVDFRVALNREGKTQDELAASYNRIAGRIGREMKLHTGEGDDRVELGGEFATRFSRLARFFDGQFTEKDGAFAVTANISRGGAVSMSGSRFDGAKLKVVSVDSPQYSFMALPKEAPKRQPGLPDKEQNGNFLQQELWAVRQASNDQYGFVTIAGGDGQPDRVTGFFGDYKSIRGHHAFRADAYDEKRTDGKGHWYYAADIIRNYYIDGSNVAAGKIVADETTSMWNGGGKLGTYTSNSIRYSDWGRRNPKMAAFAGGVAGGFISTMLDPTMLLMMVIPAGAGYLAAKIGPMALKAFKMAEMGVNAYFQATIIVHTGEGVVKVAVGIYRDDANMINEGGNAVGSAVAVGAQMLGAHVLAGKTPKGEKEGTPQREGSPAEPGKPPVEPGKPPVEPSKPPTEPNRPPAEPNRPPTEPNRPPNEPNRPPTEPNRPPTEPNRPPAEPNRPPAEPNRPPTEPSRPPVEPSRSPVEPSRPPVERGRPPMERATPPSVRPPGGGRVAEVFGGKSGLDSPGAGAELAPGGTKAAANEGGAGGGGAKAAAPKEAAAKPAETAATPKPEAAPAAAAKPAPAPEPAPSKSAPKEAAPELVADPAAPQIAEVARPGGRSAPEFAQSAELVGAAGGPPGARGGPMERAPLEAGLEPGGRIPTREGPAARETAAREPAAEPGARETTTRERRAQERPSQEASFDPASRAREAAPRGPKEGHTPEPYARPASESAPVREAAPAEAAPGRRESTAEVQREANELVGDGAAVAAAPKPGPVKAAISKGLSATDGFLTRALKPVGEFVTNSASVLERVGQAKIPGTNVTLWSGGRVIRAVQTVGIGVEAVGARFGFLGKPIKEVGMMLQGRVLAHEGRPLTFEEVWHPDLAKRPSFLEAATPEILAKGGTVEGRFDPATGRATFGPKAKGEVAVSVEVRPDGKGGVEIVDYAAKTTDPRLAAQAHGEMYGQLERTFQTEIHQHALDNFFANKDVRAKLNETAGLKGEAFIDVVYDAGGRRLKLAEPGQGEARLRLVADEAGRLRLAEAEPLVEGGRLPPALNYNLRLFAARRGVSLAEGTPLAPEPTAEVLGARLAERVKAEKLQVAQENVYRQELAEARVKSADGKLAAAEGNVGAAPAKVRELARQVAELRIQKETANLEIKAADERLAKLGVPEKAVARAVESLTAREKAGRALDEAGVARERAETAFNALAEGDPGFGAARRALAEAAAAETAAAKRFRIADENASRLGGEITEAGVEALVRRQAASERIAAIEETGRGALRDLRTELRAARDGGGKADAGAALARERFDAAVAAREGDIGIREYRLDGLHRSTGGDGRRLATMRALALKGEIQSGRASVGQAAGENLCVVATAADMAFAARGRPAGGAMGEAEAAIKAHFGEKKGHDFLVEASKNGLTPVQAREMMSIVAESAGLKLVEIPPERLFTELAAGRQIAVTMTHVADATTGFGGGPHMVNLSNWRQARNPLTGRVETMIDVADPNVRVKAGKDASGAPVYEARVVTRSLAELLPDIRATLHGEGPAAGYAFEAAGAAGPRAPPKLPPAELARRMGAEGIGAAEPAPVVRKPAGFDRGAPKVLDPNYLPAEVYSPEIMSTAREYGLVYELSPANVARMKPGVKHNYVIVERANGTIEMTVARLSEGNVKEVGVKHAAIGGEKPVVFSGEVVVNASGKPVLDFNSGTYSQVGLDARWTPTPTNARALKAYAETIMGRPVEVVDHFKKTVIETGSAELAVAPRPEGIGAGVRQPEGFAARRGEVFDFERLNHRFRDPAQMEMRRKDGQLFEMAPEKLARITANAGEVHNYVITRSPEGLIEMVVGRYKKGDGEYGVKHAQLANGREVLFSGEIARDAKTGELRLDFNSGTFSDYGKNRAWNPTPENARSLAAHAEAILGHKVTVWDHFAKREVPLDGTVAGAQSPDIRGRPVGVLSPEVFRYDSPIRIQASNKTFEIISREDLARRAPEWYKGVNPNIEYFLLDAKRPTDIKALRDGEVVTVGRDTPQRFDLPENFAKKHFQVERVGNEFRISDLGSFKGTEVAARPEPAVGRELEPGVALKLGAEPVVRLELGGKGRDGGRRIEILSREEMVKRWPILESQLNAKLDRYIVDPANPAQFKGLRVGEEVVLGRGEKGRFEFGTDVSRQHVAIKRTAEGYELLDKNSTNGTRVLDLEPVRVAEPAAARPVEPAAPLPPPIARVEPPALKPGPGERPADFAANDPRFHARIFEVADFQRAGIRELTPNKALLVPDGKVTVELGPKGASGGAKLEIVTREELVSRRPEMASNLNPAIDRYLIDPADPSRVKALRVGEEVALGRSEQGRFQFNADVSRNHATIKRVEGGYEIVDRGSTNGTRVRSEPAAAKPEGIGAATLESPRSVRRRGATRGEGWEVDGKPAQRLSGGAFKEVLIHPSDANLVLKLFSEMGAKDTAGSLSEKRAEMRNLEPLLAIGRAPRIVDSGALIMETPSGKKTTGFVVQERVNGRELGDMLRDPDPAVRARAMEQARALFNDLVAARVKLEDRVKMHENVSVGRAGKSGEKAWVLDAGEARLVEKPGMMDSLLGRPDPLRAYYDGVLADLAKISRGAEPALARGRREGIGATADATRYERYFSKAEIRAAHPEPASGNVYHDWQHTVKVADMAGEFATARGLPPGQAKFVSEVALLHDFDPSRSPGMPARVPATIEALRADFARTKSLTGEAGSSVLRDRFGWTESQLKMAEAIIQRTEFPFAENHPSPAYAKKSPLAHYQEMLAGLSPADRAFVLREAPLLSEYADKSSWYATENFAGAHKVVEGLVNEINRASGKQVVSAQTLGTSGFLKVVGESGSFTHDMALAAQYGVELKLPNRAEAFKLLPDKYGRTFESNLKGFAEFDAASKAGDAAAFDKALAVADAAARPASRPEGIGAGWNPFGKKAPSTPERGPASVPVARLPVEPGGPKLEPLPEGLRLSGASLRPGQFAAEAGGRQVVLKTDASPNEGAALALMAQVKLPPNVTVAKVVGEGAVDPIALDKLAGQGVRPNLDFAAIKRSSAEGRRTLAVEAPAEGFVPLLDAAAGKKLGSPISAADWQGFNTAIEALGRKGLALGDLSGVRVRQVLEGGVVRTEFLIAEAGKATHRGNIEVLSADYRALKGVNGSGGLERALISAKLLGAEARISDPAKAAMARNQVAPTQTLAEQLNAKMKDGGGARPAESVRVQSQRFTDLDSAAAFLRAPEGMHLLEKTSEGLAGDTVRVEIAGEAWYAKRVSKKLGGAIDEGLRGLSASERMGNELAMREIVRRNFGETFGVAPEAIAIEHGGEIFVMTKGAAAAPAPERLKTMTPAERADYALLRLVFRAEDLNRGNVLFGKDGKPTLIDFEKVIAEPLDPARVAREADNEIFVKGFPIVSLEGNNLAVYKAHADRLRARFAEPSFKPELRGVLERAGWTPERIAKYLEAVETNLANFERNITPYIEISARVAAKRKAEGIGSAHEDVPKFIKDAAKTPKPEDIDLTKKPEEVKIAPAAPAIIPLTDNRLTAHVMAYELADPAHGNRYIPRLILGGGHTEKGFIQMVRLVSESLEVKRALYLQDQVDMAAAIKRQDQRAKNKLQRIMDSSKDFPLPAQGTHWTERPDAIKWLPEYPNGVKRVVLPEEAYHPDAWGSMGNMTRWVKGYEQGGKTMFPEKWTAEDIRTATAEVAEKGVIDTSSPRGIVKRGTVTRHGQTVIVDVQLDASGRTSTSYPAWNQ